MLRISIITVCRNDRKGLEDTSTSIRSQSGDDFEWWVIDGNSDDGTVGWLKENHNFPGGWISEPDNGIYDAMNKGIGLAAGEYLLFMNSGDLLAGPEVVSQLARRIEAQKAAPDFVYGDSLDRETSGRTNYRQALPVSYVKYGMPTRHQAMVYRRERLVHERYPPDFKLSGDYAVTASLLMKSSVRVLKVDFPICLFSLGGAHDTRRLEALREDFRIRHTILKANPVACVLLFCVHWLHHYLRMLAPSLNRKFIYTTSGD